ncbi:alpha/beta-hydrolase [Obba rivulosa]|uniref:sn-1-specific diacylglycerol lipase n=1 Tax=Obba rivulosa TaxID=1052685 RepID=A0A8E2J2B8_9APHY|nr:alpha/beta-hydrolase [Obba rivulosa]
MNTTKLDKYSRFGLDFAAAATSLGFSAVKASTKLGFCVTRGIAATAAGLTGAVVDHALFGGSMGAGRILRGAASAAVTSIESVILAPILLGETITSTSLVAAHSSLAILATVFPGSDEASFSLASFIELVRREWTDPAAPESLPEERYTPGQVAKALVAWATLQGVTSEWQERNWLKHMREIHVNDPADQSQTADTSTQSRIHITADVIYPHRSGQIVTADIGEAPSHAVSAPSSGQVTPCQNNEHQHLKQTLRRMSKMVLGGYGGASLLFFGVPLRSSGSSQENEKEKRLEEAKLAEAVSASEAEAKPSLHGNKAHTWSWWNVLMGRHDHDIFLEYARHPETEADATRPPTAIVSSENLMPRFWVLTDHARREVVLVLRGTMSLNELAVDLTCDPAPFELDPSIFATSRSHSRLRKVASEDMLRGGKGKGRGARDEGYSSWSEFEEELENIPGSFPVDFSTAVPDPRERAAGASTESLPSLPSTGPDEQQHMVHGGMLKMARAMGAPGKPVHVAVRHALKKNHGYSLVLCGHSLGAGVAALLALMWANPYTRLTHLGSGLPTRRKVSAYCFAPPCLASSQLADIAATSGLITSLIYSHDVVSRLSLGSVRDMTRACNWLCKAEDSGKGCKGEGYTGVTKRALKGKAGLGEEGDDEWFIAVRKTLEANMHMTHLYPAGKVYWAQRDGLLHPTHRIFHSGNEDKVRLFEVLNVEEVFNQIIFSRDMLSAHMPHQYDRAVHELL